MATPTQTINITITRRPRRHYGLWVFLLLLLPIAWYFGSREWNLRASYSGVVIEKGMDYNLFFGGIDPDLYFIVKDGQGRRSKRYVCSRICSTSAIRCWGDIAVGAFVVRDSGYGELPYQPGKKSPLQPASAGSGYIWIFVGLLLLCAAFMLNALRELWRALRGVFG